MSKTVFSKFKEYSKIRLSGIGYISKTSETLHFKSIPSLLLKLSSKTITNHDLFRKRFLNKVVVPNIRFRSKLSENEKVFIKIKDFVSNEEYIEKHIRFVELENDEELVKRIQKNIFKEFPKDSALWDVTIMENHSEGAFMFMRIHHSIGDGFSITQKLMRIVDEEKELYEMLQKKSDKHKLSLFGLLYYYSWVVFNWFFVLFFIFLNILRIEPKIINRPLSVKKRVSFLLDKNSLNLKRMKKIGKRYCNMTINDTYACLISYSLSKYFSIGSKVKKDKIITIRMAIPVNVRTNLIAKGLANKWGVVWVDIPLGEMSFEKRAKLIKKSTKRMKKYPFHIYMYFFSKYISPYLPKYIIKSTLSLLSTKYSTFNMSNVQGFPVDNLHIFGNKIVSSIHFVPVSPGTHLAFSLLSQGQDINIGLVSDAFSIQNPETILENVKEKYEELCKEMKL